MSSNIWFSNLFFFVVEFVDMIELSEARHRKLHLCAVREEGSAAPKVVPNCSDFFKNLILGSS